MRVNLIMHARRSRRKVASPIPHNIGMPTSIFPPLPPYNGLHPLVVHFPIALLLVVPLFIAIAAVWKAQSRAMLLSAMILCVLGTASAFLATSTGGAAEDLAEKVQGAKATLHEHEERAELARNLFIAVTVMLALVTVAYFHFYAKVGAALRIGSAIVILAICAAPALVLANAAHLGGELVHVYGVKAPLGADPFAGVGPGAAPAGSEYKPEKVRKKDD